MNFSPHEPWFFVTILVTPLHNGFVMIPASFASLQLNLLDIC